MYCLHFYGTHYLDFIIAASTFAAQGIVLDIQRNAGAQFFFYCGWWSDYSQEEECLYIGGLLRMAFKTIRNIPQNLNYESYIAPITMLNDMITGCPITIRKPLKKDCKYMNKLIFDECGDDTIGLFDKMKVIKAKTPTFINSLFHHFCVNVTELHINLNHMNKENVYKNTQFGYKVYKSIFYSDGDAFDARILVKLFQKVEKFAVFNCYSPLRGYESSMDLNDRFSVNLISTLKLLNNLSSTFKLEYLIFVKPSSSISTFIKSNQQKFKSLKWSLSQNTFKHSFWRDCKDCLYIQPLKK